MSSKHKTFSPCGPRVLVKPEEEQSVSKVIIIPDIAKETPQIAKVIAVGDGKYTHTGYVNNPFKAGDIVMISKFGGTEVKIDGEVFKLINTDDILGKFV